MALAKEVQIRFLRSIIKYLMANSQKTAVKYTLLLQGEILNNFRKY